MASDLTHVPSGYLTNASHYGLTREAAAAVAGLASVAMTDDVDALAEALKAKSVEGTLARHTAEFACSLLAMAKAHERGPERPDPGVERKSWLSERMLIGAGMPGVERKPSLAERMPAYVRRATVDCALSAGWVCIATLATVDPVRWRTICYALSDTFALKLKTLEAMTLQSLHRARSSVGA
jgi:hypothetical protein